MAVRSLICIGVCLALSACGGGGDSGSDTQPVAKSAIKGKAIDGYIKGATVYLDLNFNKQMNAGEPSVVTTDSGDYYLELTEDQKQCAEYVPLVVDVPVGAVDLDTGVVEQAYQMVLPPKFAPLTDDDLKHVTPLTTVLWSEVEKQLANDGTLTCQSVMANRQTREKIARELDAATDRMVHHYNISEQKLYDDYIASGDTETATMAMEIVRGLQASFKETDELKKANPTAIYAYVDYHIGDYRDADYASPDAWYREQEVFWDDHVVSELDKVSPDFTQVVRKISYSERFIRKTADYSYANWYTLESRQGDDSPYSCSVEEKVEHVAGSKTYEMINTADFQADTFEECVIDDMSEAVTQRSASVSSTVDGVSSNATFFYDRPAGSFPFLNKWVDMSATLDTFNMADLTAALEQLPYGFEDDTPEPDATNWMKSQTSTDAEGVKTEIRYTKGGDYTKIVTQSDGTYKTECGTDGVTWGTCKK